MRICSMCTASKADVTVVQVTPAAWNGYHDFREVCVECRDSRRFQTWTKTSRPKRRGCAPIDAPTTTPGDKGGDESSSRSVLISHRRTGALLRKVESDTLERACLSGALLAGADLQHAAMCGIELHRADLRLADLAGADLRGADLRGTNLRGADLRGTDLREAQMYAADLSLARYDDGTRWPANYSFRTCGAVREARSG